MIKTLPYPVIFLAVLSGCGAGGATAIAPFSSFAAIPRDGTFIMEGKAVTVGYTATPAGVVSAGKPLGPKNASVVVTTTKGRIAAENIQVGAIAAAFDSRIIGTSVVTKNGVSTIVTPSGTTIMKATDLPSKGFAYQTFGEWMTGYGTGSGTAIVVSTGAKTPVAAVPTGKTATYAGSSIGFMVDGSGTPFFTTSDINVTTNFTTATIKSANTGLENANTSKLYTAPMFDFTGTGPVSGAGFKAFVSNSANTIAGTANGIFYGPSAQEVGGTFRTSGTGYKYSGSFGAN